MAVDFIAGCLGGKLILCFACFCVFKNNNYSEALGKREKDVSRSDMVQKWER